MNIAEAIAATKAARESHPVEVVDLDTHQDSSPAAGSHVGPAPKPRPLDGVTSADEFLRGSPLEFAHLALKIAPSKAWWTNQDNLSLKLGRVTRAEIVTHDPAGDPP